MNEDPEKESKEFAERTLRSIIMNYQKTEASTVDQLNFNTPNHYSTIGSFREGIWRQLFEQIVPKKYAIEQSVFIMDSNEHISREVDLAIFDEMYTPYIFRNGRIKFIPIEAVAAVVQCKSKSKERDDLEQWCLSISKLKTSQNAIARMATSIASRNYPVLMQTATRPIQILCRLSDSSKKITCNDLFDIELVADDASEQIKIYQNPKLRTLRDWFNELNRHGVKLVDKTTLDQQNADEKKDFVDEGTETLERTNYTLEEYSIQNAFKQSEVSLLSFNLQFNQLLMLINNPMLFPHKAYADLFNKIYADMPGEDCPKSDAKRKE